MKRSPQSQCLRGFKKHRQLVYNHTISKTLSASFLGVYKLTGLRIGVQLNKFKIPGPNPLSLINISAIKHQKSVLKSMSNKVSKLEFKSIPKFKQKIKNIDSAIVDTK